MEQKIKRFVNQTKTEFKRFFGYSLGSLKVITLGSRRELNKLRGRKTPDWFVGSFQNNSVYILSEENFEKESCHKKEYFWSVLKHEIAHLYIHKIVKSKKPVWIHEGVAGFLAGQVRKDADYKESIKAIDFYGKFGREVYGYSSKFVEFLFNKYGKKKLIDFMKSLKQSITKKQYEENFKKIYGIHLKKDELKEEVDSFGV